MNAVGGFVAGSIVAKLLLDKTGWNAGIKDVEKDTKKLGETVTELGAKYTTSGKLIAAMGGAIVGALGFIVKNTANAGDAIYDLSQRTGIAAELLSAYKIATEKAGSSMQGFAMGMRGLSGRMMDAKNGLAESKRAFDELGIAVLDNEGKLRPLNDVLLEVADKFSRMEDGTAKAALAQDLFGRSGMELIPLLNKGADGLRQAADDAARFGTVFDKQAAAAADKFNDALVDAKASLSGLGIQIGQILLPVAEGLVKVFTSLVSKVTEFAQKNGAVTQALVGMGSTFGVLLTAVGSLQLVLGTILTKLPLLAAALQTTTSALVLSTLAWTAGAAAVGYYLMKLVELETQQARMRGAEAALGEQQGQVITQLQEAARRTMVATNDLKNWVTSAAMDEIIASYARFGDNAVNMARQAILAGEHGVALQSALRQVADESAAAFDKTRGPVEAVAGAIAGAGEAVRTFTTLTQSAILTARECSNMFSNWTTTLVNGFLPAAKQLPAAMKDWLYGPLKEGAGEMKTFYDQVFADIINGFTSIMDGSKSMGEFFSSIVTTMIGDLGKLVIAEILMAKKSILADQMKAVAAYIASVFKKVPFPFNIALAAGGFALISKLFKGLFKFDEGGYFKKKSIIPMAQVAENEPEFIAPESKLIEAVRTAMAMPMAAPALAPAMAGVGAGGFGNAYITLNMHTTGLSRRDVMEARALIFEAFDREAVKRGYKFNRR